MALHLPGYVCRLRLMHPPPLPPPPLAKRRRHRKRVCRSPPNRIVHALPPKPQGLTNPSHEARLLPALSGLYLLTATPMAPRPSLVPTENPAKHAGPTTPTASSSRRPSLESPLLCTSKRLIPSFEHLYNSSRGPAHTSSYISTRPLSPYPPFPPLFFRTP